MNITSILRRSDPRVVVMAVLTLLAVMFCIYKMVGAFAGTDGSPAYDRTPPTAFAVPLTDTLVDAQALNQPRLPDEAYTILGKETASIGSQIASQQLTATELETAGMNSDDASSALAQVKAYYGLYAGRRTSVERGFSLNSVSTVSADVTQTIDYSAGADGSPSGSFSLDYAYSYLNGSWILNSLTASF